MKALYQSLAGLILMGAFGSACLAQDQSIKQKLEADGFQFLQQIEAPANMTGWAGHLKQSPMTVFISNDQKYYILGDLFDQNQKNLSEQALDKYVKKAVLSDIWNNLEASTWIQDGSPEAAKIVYVFSDVNCPYCRAFWKEARPQVDAGKLQLRHIMVGVIRPESKGQAASLLSTGNPAQTFKQFNESGNKVQFKEMKNIPSTLSDKLDTNMALMAKYGFFATPALLWKDKDGELKSAQGLPQGEVLKEVLQ